MVIVKYKLSHTLLDGSTSDVPHLIAAIIVTFGLLNSAIWRGCGFCKTY